MARSRVWLGSARRGIERSKASVYGIRVWLKSVGGGGVLDDPAGVHDGDLVGAAGHHAEVVGDEDHGHGTLPLLGGQEVEDLGLHRDVETGGGLVGQQQLGAAGQGDGDHDPLAHAARQLVGVVPHAALGSSGCRPR